MNNRSAKLASWAALAAAVALIGCGGDSKGSGSGDPVGGWSSAGRLFACFHQDGTVGFGDHAGEAAQVPASLEWTDDGKITGDGVPAGTTWKLEGDELTLNAPCNGDGCGAFKYQRDDS